MTIKRKGIQVRMLQFDVPKGREIEYVELIEQAERILKCREHIEQLNQMADDKHDEMDSYMLSLIKRLRGTELAKSFDSDVTIDEAYEDSLTGEQFLCNLINAYGWRYKK